MILCGEWGCKWENETVSAAGVSKNAHLNNHFLDW